MKFEIPNAPSFKVVKEWDFARTYYAERIVKDCKFIEISAGLTESGRELFIYILMVLVISILHVQKQLLF